MAAPVDILASKKEVRIGGSKFAIPPSFYRRQEEKRYCAEEVRFSPQSKIIIALKERSMKGYYESLDFGRDLSPLERKYLINAIKDVGSDVFSRHEFDLGKTSIVKHHIDTGTANQVYSLSN